MRLLLLGAAILFLAGCANITEGAVIAKGHEDDRTYSQIMPVYTGETCVTVGKTRSCTPRYIYMPFTYYDDEDWKLRVRDDDGKEGWVYVTPDVWDRMEVGSYWSQTNDGGGSADPTAKVG